MATFTEAELRQLLVKKKTSSKRRRGKSVKSAHEEEFAVQLASSGLPAAVREHCFAKPRRWRFDFAWPDQWIALEIEGGTWGSPVTCHQCGVKVVQVTSMGKRVQVRRGGRHQTGKGFTEDIRKYNAAARLGWRVFRVTGEMVKKGEAIELMEEILAEAAALDAAHRAAAKSKGD